MQRTLARITLLLLAALVSRAMGGSEPAVQTEFRPGKVWLDTAGQPINAHGGGLLFHNGAYYWYGENKVGRTWLPESTKSWDGYRVDVTGIRCYSSRDLLNWKDEGLVLKAVADDPAHDLHPSKVCERPKVVYNASTKKFVMWLHIDSEGYKAARAGVAVAERPTGPFTYLESVRPEGQDSKDQTVFQDDDGKAYRIYSSENNDTTYISLLTDDYLKHSGKFARIFVKRRMEAHAVFKHAGKYWYVGSDCTGWDPNPARSAVADSLWGPWTELGNPCRGAGAGTTFNGQSTFVAPVQGQPGSFIFMADRWNKTDLPASRYLWLPLTFTEKGFEIDWRDAWRLDDIRDAQAPVRAQEPRGAVSGKKGIGHWAANMPQAVDELGCAWYYNWKPAPGADAKDTRAEFVPMIWDEQNLDAHLAAARQSGATVLLGFNEPDNREQANMTVAEAVVLWPKLMATGLRLGSPAPTTDTRWLDAFMIEAKRHNLRVDFMCLHWYGDITGDRPVEALRQYLQRVHDRYRLPIWLTEFSGADFDHHKRRTTVQDNATFARDAALLLESLPYVERYAWFSSKWTPKSEHYSQVGLYDEQTQALTPVGQAYRGQPKRDSVAAAATGPCGQTSSEVGR